jgi:hypothetical protein
MAQAVIVNCRVVLPTTLTWATRPFIYGLSSAFGPLLLFLEDCCYLLLQFVRSQCRSEKHLLHRRSFSRHCAVPPIRVTGYAQNQLSDMTTAFLYAARDYCSYICRLGLQRAEQRNQIITIR